MQSSAGHRLTTQPAVLLALFAFTVSVIRLRLQRQHQPRQQEQHHQHQQPQPYSLQPAPDHQPKDIIRKRPDFNAKCFDVAIPKFADGCNFTAMTDLYTFQRFVCIDSIRCKYTLNGSKTIITLWISSVRSFVCRKVHIQNVCCADGIQV